MKASASKQHFTVLGAGTVACARHCRCSAIASRPVWGAHLAVVVSSSLALVCRSPRLAFSARFRRCCWIRPDRSSSAGSIYFH